MWVIGINYGYFIVWIKVYKLLYERVEFNREYFSVVLNNIILFYKIYVLLVLLGYRDIYQCLKCDKVILEELEIIDMLVENSICCDICSIWWYLLCVNFLQDVVELLELWMCYSCLVDVVDSDFDSDSDFDDVFIICIFCDIEMDFIDSVIVIVDNVV